MTGKNEYLQPLQTLYNKSLFLENPSEFNQVLYFYYMDSIAHIDYSLSLLAYNYQSVRNMMNMEYLRWRIDEEKKGDRVHFPAFINWLKEEYPEKFDTLPVIWKEIYDKSSPASYRSFNISLDPVSFQPVQASFFQMAIEEFFSPRFIKSLYKDGSLGKLFDEFMSTIQ